MNISPAAKGDLSWPAVPAVIGGWTSLTATILTSRRKDRAAGWFTMTACASALALTPWLLARLGGIAGSWTRREAREERVPASDLWRVALVVAFVRTATGVWMLEEIRDEWGRQLPPAVARGLALETKAEALVRSVSGLLLALDTMRLVARASP